MNDHKTARHSVIRDGVVFYSTRCNECQWTHTVPHSEESIQAATNHERDNRSTEPKIYTAAEVASAGFSKEEIDQAVAKVTQRAYKAAKYGEKSITHGADNYLLHQIAKRLRELGYTVQLTQESAVSKYIIIWWDNAHPDKENKEMSDIQETINRLRELDREVSPAPWSITHSDSLETTDDGGIFIEDAEEGAIAEADVDFCHHSFFIDDALPLMVKLRNALPALLAEIDRLTIENQALTAELTEAGVPIKPLKENK